jgi:outer membrane protein assembly factor BamB
VLTGQNLVSYDPDTHKELWSVPFSHERKINAAMPVVIGDTVFLTSNYKLGSALVKVTDGKAEIAWKNEDLQGRFTTPLLNDGCIYGIGEGFMVCIDPKTGKTAWKQPGFENGGLMGIDGVIIGMDGKGGDAVMVQFAPDACKELGRFTPLGGQSWTAPIVADGKMIVRNTKEMACFNIK